MAASKTSGSSTSTAAPTTTVGEPRNVYKVNLQISACPVGDDDTEVYYKVTIP